MINISASFPKVESCKESNGIKRAFSKSFSVFNSGNFRDTFFKLCRYLLTLSRYMSQL